MSTNEQQAACPDEEEMAQGVAQAKALREPAKQGGLRFEAYLPPELADWLLGTIEQGSFTDPSEAVFVILGQHKELAPHVDLRRELLQRLLQASIDDPRPGIPAEEVLEDLRKRIDEPRPEPAAWKQRRSFASCWTTTRLTSPRRHGR